MVMPLLALSLLAQAQPQGEFFYDPIFPESLLQYFVEDTSSLGWQEIGDKWLIYIISASALCVLLMVAWKVWLKETAPNPILKTWTLGKTFGFIAFGFIPVIGFCLIAWKFLLLNADIIGAIGLMTGTIVGMGIYFFFIIVIHLAIWRRDLFNPQS